MSRSVHRLHMAVLRRNTPEIPEDILDKASASMAPKKTAILVGQAFMWAEKGESKRADHHEIGPETCGSPSWCLSMTLWLVKTF